MAFYEQISHPVSEEKVTDGIWREFSDGSPQRFLLGELSKHGMSRNVVCWVGENKGTPDWWPVTSGIPQGLILINISTNELESRFDSNFG